MAAKSFDRAVNRFKVADMKKPARYGLDQFTQREFFLADFPTTNRRSHLMSSNEKSQLSTAELITEISKYLVKRPPEIISNQRIIDKKLIEFLRSQSGEDLERVKKMFFQSGYPYPKWNWEHLCLGCKKHHLVSTSKSILFDIVFNKKKNRKEWESKEFLCPSCQAYANAIEAMKNKEQLEILKRQSEDRTVLFIETYLTPCSLKIEVPKYWDLKQIIQWDENCCSKIREFVVSMNYRDFLKTPYWKSISQYIKKKSDFKCQICSSNINLNVHHRNYTNLGNELFDTSDLICLCQICHQKFHENFKKN